ncbi:MAG: hypothetical protein NTX00_05290 [Candidatus Parcubacteria bacterium]|nr:hypothetical protein [Candidatus Parcubacteria bacterium]
MDVIPVEYFPLKKVCKECGIDWNSIKNSNGKCHNCGSTESKWVHFDPETKEIVKQPRLIGL